MNPEHINGEDGRCVVCQATSEMQGHYWLPCFQGRPGEMEDRKNFLASRHVLTVHRAVRFLFPHLFPKGIRRVHA